MTLIRDVVDVQLLRPGGYLLLGRSRLGTGQLAPATGALVWSSVLGDATQVTIQRGTRRDGLATSVDVGTMTVRLRDAGTPMTDAALRPNTPVRAVTKVAGLPLFTGRVVDVAVDYELDRFRRLVPVVTLLATDAVADLVQTKRYGAANPAAEWESWEARAGRLLQSSPVPYLAPAVPETTPVLSVDVQPMTSTAAAAEAALWKITAPANAVDTLGLRHLVLTSTRFREVPGLIAGDRYVARVLAAGTVGQPMTVQTPDGVFSSTSLVQTWGPALYELEFTARNGGGFPLVDSRLNSVQVASPIAAGGANTVRLYSLEVYRQTRAMVRNIVLESSLAAHLDLLCASARAGWYVDASGRVRLQQSTPNTVRINQLTNPAFTTTATPWATTGAATAARVTAGQRTGAGALRVVTTAASAGVLVPVASVASPGAAGAPVTVGAWVQAPAGTVMSVQAQEYTPASALVGTTSRPFTATGGWDYVTVQRRIAATGNKVRPAVLSTTAVTFFLDDALLEFAAVAGASFNPESHLDSWWTGAVGASTSALLVDELPAVSFSDVHTDELVHAHYTDAQVSFDTRTVVNSLEIVTQSRALDAEGAWVAAETTHGPYVDVTSAATWGARSTVLDTCLADLPGTAYWTSTDELGAAILAAKATPEPVVSRVVWNVQDVPEQAAAVDVYSRVDVKVRELTQQARVAAIRHDITPSRWITTLDLIERTAR